MRPLLVLCAALLASCSDSTEPDITKISFAPSLGIDLSKMTKTANGVYIRDLTVGTGATAAAGKQVSFHYIGWLTDGTQFDANQPPATPARSSLGTGGLIPGFDEGMRGMQVGGRRQMVIPPGLAYGREGNGPIPPNAVIVFQVDLVGVQ